MFAGFSGGGGGQGGGKANAMTELVRLMRHSPIGPVTTGSQKGRKPLKRRIRHPRCRIAQPIERGAMIDDKARQRARRSPGALGPDLGSGEQAISQAEV